MARRRRSVGVEERGMQARVLQEPGSSPGLPDQGKREGRALKKWPRPNGCGIEDRAERKTDAIGNSAATATERRCRDQEKSEPASGTEEAGEPDRRDPVEGRRWRV
jgi:hypothetical protein